MFKLRFRKLARAIR